MSPTGILCLEVIPVVIQLLVVIPARIRGLEAPTSGQHSLTTATLMERRPKSSASVSLLPPPTKETTVWISRPNKKAGREDHDVARVELSMI